jgi:hypothetical protein
MDEQNTSSTNSLTKIKFNKKINSNLNKDANIK